MPNQPYQNSEIDQHFAAMNARMTAFEFDARQALARIEMQTTTINGRVSKLEKWRNYVVGFCAAVTFMLTTALTIAAILWKASTPASH
jgi:hypothetical protein